MVDNLAESPYSISVSLLVPILASEYHQGVLFKPMAVDYHNQKKKVFSWRAPIVICYHCNTFGVPEKSIVMLSQRK